MRDTRGQLADGFHFLRLPQLHLELNSICDVLGDTDKMVYFPFGVRNRKGTIRNPTYTAVGPDDAVVFPENTLQLPRERLFNALLILGWMASSQPAGF